MPDPLPAIVVLGSNIAPADNLPAAVRLLAELGEVAAVSSAWATHPVGPPGQPPFANAAVLLRTDCAPTALKFELLRQVEARLGRRRSADRFAPRPIDLDLVAHGDQVIDPDLLRHAHLALPASEVAPHWAPTGSAETLRTVAQRLLAQLPADQRPRRLALALGAPKKEWPEDHSPGHQEF